MKLNSRMNEDKKEGRSIAVSAFIVHSEKKPALARFVVCETMFFLLLIKFHSEYPSSWSDETCQT